MCYFKTNWILGGKSFLYLVDTGNLWAHVCKQTTVLVSCNQAPGLSDPLQKRWVKTAMPISTAEEAGD